MKNSVVLSGVIAAVISIGAHAEPSAFVSGSLGQSKYKSDGFSESATSFGVGGGYWFNENFAIEGRYDDFGEIENTYQDGTATENSKASASALGINLLAGVPLNEQFKLYAKIGVSFWDFDAESVTSFPDDAFDYHYKASFSGNDFNYGFGAEYKANDSISIGAEYSALTIKDRKQIDAEEFAELDGDINNFNIYARFNF